MATILELKNQLIAKGYQAAVSPSLPIALFTHPLITAPVVIVGADSATAKPLLIETYRALGYALPSL